MVGYSVALHFFEHDPESISMSDESEMIVQCHFEFNGSRWEIKNATALDGNGRPLNKFEKDFTQNGAWMNEKPNRIEVVWSFLHGVKLSRAWLDWPCTVESYTAEESLLKNPYMMKDWHLIRREVLKQALTMNGSCFSID